MMRRIVSLLFILGLWNCAIGQSVITSCPPDNEQILCTWWMQDIIQDAMSGCGNICMSEPFNYEIGYFDDNGTFYYYYMIDCVDSQFSPPCPTSYTIYDCNGTVISFCGGSLCTCGDSYFDSFIGVLNNPIWNCTQGFLDCSSYNSNLDICSVIPDYIADTEEDYICGADGNIYINDDVMSFCYGVSANSNPSLCDFLCDNGQQDVDEEELDCGGSFCPPCTETNLCCNQIQDGDEEGIDCGGSSCIPCNSAFSCPISIQVFEVNSVPFNIAIDDLFGGISGNCNVSFFKDSLGQELNIDCSDFGASSSIIKNQWIYNVEEIGVDSCLVNIQLNKDLNICTCTDSDYLALMSLYNTANGDNWNRKNGWDKGLNGQNCNPCFWEGVTCNQAGFVTEISLWNNNLSGYISETFGGMPYLRLLSLRENLISGTIPASIFLNPRLEFLDCSRNSFMGPLPLEIGDCNSLIGLTLSSNPLNDTIPDVFNNLDLLEKIWLERAELTGFLPTSFSEMDSIKGIWLGQNDLSGCYPEEYIAFCNTSTLRVNSNPKLPSFNEFCNGFDQLGQLCDDGNPSTSNDQIDENCECNGDACENEDYFYLIYLYEVFNGFSWTNKGTNINPQSIENGWNLDCNYCNWYGIECNEDGRIISIDLSSNNLSGAMDSVIHKLSDWTRVVDFSENKIVDTIPEVLSTIWWAEINLSSNLLFGCIEQNTLSGFCNSLPAIDLTNNRSLPNRGNLSELCINMVQEGAPCGMEGSDSLIVDCICMSSINLCNGSYSFSYPDIVCADDWQLNFTINNGSPPYNFELFRDGLSVFSVSDNISGGATIVNPMGSENAIFTASVTDAEGCSDFMDISPPQNIQVEAGAIAHIEFPNGNSSAEGQTIEFEAIINQSNYPPVDFEVFGLGSTIIRTDINQTTTLITVLGTLGVGTYDVSIRATDDLGCSQGVSVPVSYEIVEDVTLTGCPTSNSGILCLDWLYMNLNNSFCPDPLGVIKKVYTTFHNGEPAILIDTYINCTNPAAFGADFSLYVCDEQGTLIDQCGYEGFSTTCNNPPTSHPTIGPAYAQRTLIYDSGNDQLPQNCSCSVIHCNNLSDLMVTNGNVVTLSMGDVVSNFDGACNYSFSASSASSQLSFSCDDLGNQTIAVYNLDDTNIFCSTTVNIVDGGDCGATNEVELVLSNKEGNKGDTISIDVTTRYDMRLAYMQGSFNWDSDVIRFIDIENLNLNIPQISQNNFNVDNASTGQVLLFYAHPNGLQNFNLGVGERLFTFRYVIVGDPSESTQVLLTDNPTAIEFGDQNANDFSTFSSGGLVTVENAQCPSNTDSLLCLSWIQNSILDTTFCSSNGGEVYFEIFTVPNSSGGVDVMIHSFLTCQNPSVSAATYTLFTCDSVVLASCNYIGLAADCSSPSSHVEIGPAIQNSTKIFDSRMDQFNCAEPNCDNLECVSEFEININPGEEYILNIQELITNYNPACYYSFSGVTEVTSLTIDCNSSTGQLYSVYNNQNNFNPCLIGIIITGCDSMSDCSENVDTLLCQSWLQETVGSISCEENLPNNESFYTVSTVEYNGTTHIIIYDYSFFVSENVFNYYLYNCDGSVIDSCNGGFTGNCQDVNNHPIIGPLLSSSIEIFHCRNDQFNCDSGSPCSHPNYNALMALYNATDGDNWTKSGTISNPESMTEGWGKDCEPCTWFGISCIAGQVVELNLEGLNLTGSLPNELSQLSELEVLFLKDNNISGSIEPVLTNTKLVHLNVEINNLSGQIPNTINQLTNLNRLSLTRNNLIGPIPESIGDLTNLESLYLGENGLSGDLPMQMGMLNNLQTFSAGINQLEGELIPELAALPGINNIQLHNNNFTGCVDPAYCSVPILGLFDNDFLPFGGDVAELCANVGDQIGAPCGMTLDSIIDINCICVEQPCPSIDWINVPTDISINCDQLASIDLDLAYTNNGQTDCEFAGSVPADTTITTIGCDKIITLDWTAMENGITITAEQKITITNIPDPKWIDPPSDKTINCDDISNIDDQLSYSNGEQGICEISGQISATIDISQALCVEDRTLNWILPKSNQDCYPIEYTQQITVAGCNDFIINDENLSASTQENLIFDLLDNDIYPIGDHTISILSIGDALVVDTSLSQDGDFSFRLADSFFDTIKVEYEVCDTFCTVCDTATFFITDEILEDIIPTSVITPNNDGTNDFLRFTRDEMIEESELWIYNRWGDQLFHQTDYTNDWDASGIPAGVYFYVLRVRGIELKKTLTILK